MDRQTAFRKALRELVAIDLASGYYKHLRPPIFCRDHNQKILQITLLRHKFTRAATVLEGSEDGPEALLAEKLLCILNGDWSEAFVQHYCFAEPCPCGGTKERCVDTCCALLEAVILDRAAEKVPSCNRWHTVAPTLETQGLGLLLHNTLGRTSKLLSQKSGVDLGPDIDAALPPGADDSISAFRLHNAKKDRKARSWLSRLDAPVTVAVACCATEPTDHLMARLQRLDDTGYAGPWLQFVCPTVW